MSTSSTTASNLTRQPGAKVLSLVESSEQFTFSVRPPMQQVDEALIIRQPTMTAALKLCQTLSGLEDKEFVGQGGIVKDAAQWSRVMNAGQHNFPHDKLNAFMDLAGNEAPLLWLLYSRGYDLSSMRQRESETEQKLREAHEEIAALRRVLMNKVNL